MAMLGLVVVVVTVVLVGHARMSCGRTIFSWR